MSSTRPNFATVTPDFTGSIFTIQDLDIARGVFNFFFERYAPGWGSSPTGVMGQLWNQDSRPAVEQLIDIARVLSDFSRGITKDSAPIFGQKIRQLLNCKDKAQFEELLAELCVALDFVQDPGNLGTIVRAAAWFGIRNIVCSGNCVDVYNPKVIQATMGAILHVNIYYSDIKRLISLAHEKNIPVYGTVLDGVSIYSHKLGSKGIILLGNESRGISDELMPLVTDKIMIPGVNRAMPGIESLNVGMAASVVFAEFLRQKGKLSD